eukprot:COSAG01_NODE_29778_length_635_cov_0.700565_1_plen_46_part_10
MRNSPVLRTARLSCGSVELDYKLGSRAKAATIYIEGGGRPSRPSHG